MGLYQKEYSFRGVVFSKSPAIIHVADFYNLTVIKNVSCNTYGLPFFRSIFQQMRTKVNAQYYGYINSDILLHPRVFELLPIITTKMKNNLLSNRIELISRVKVTNVSLIERDFSSMNNLYNVFNRVRDGILRHEDSIV